MVSIIILSYNTSSLLKNCLNSIYSQIKNVEFEVIVVDNNSSDDSVKMLKNDFKKVKLIVNSENLGFTKGCNIGAKQALGEYLLFLNSDTEFINQTSLQSMLSQLKNQKIGVVGGMMLNKDGSYQRSYGSFYTLMHVAKMLFLGEKGEMQGIITDRVHETDWVSGGFMLVRKSSFDLVQGYDEDYFMYIEDVDLCYRLKQKGIKIVVDPSIQILHTGHGSSNRTFAVTSIYKGLNLFYKKHKNIVEYTSLQILLYAKAYGAMIFATIKGDKTVSDRYHEAISSL